MNEEIDLGNETQDEIANTPASVESINETTTDEQPNSLLDAVRAVVEISDDIAPGPETDTTETAVTAKAEGTETGSETDPDADPSDDDINAIQKPRIKAWVRKALSQRDEARNQLEAVRPEADMWQQHTNWMRDQGITTDEYQSLYQVAAMLKSGDYESFMRIAGPHLERAQFALGERLPADLQAAVDDGRITPELAREYARAQSTVSVNAARAQASARQHEETSQRDLSQSIQTTIASWEATMRASDPDYAKKAGAIESAVHALVAKRGNPRSADEALSYAQEALKQANGWFASATPAAKPTRPTPSSASSTTVATPSPRSFLEAVQLAARHSG